MENMTHDATRYPAALVNWAGHHSGGVRRLFDDNSGRPNKQVLPTNLLARLQSWAQQFAQGVQGTPRILFLVGGPGNGKTEAIESTIRWLDEALGCGQKLVQQLEVSFHPDAGKAVPRIVHVDAGSVASPMRQCELRIVQDASVNAGHEGKSPSELLIDELNAALDGTTSSVYLCCVNRGILDDALIHVQETGMDRSRGPLEAITRAVSLAPDAPSCWPLEAFGSIAVWPMDAESLLVKTDAGMTSPAAVLFGQALEEEHWPKQGSCAAEDKCPFCNSRVLLARDVTRDSLLKILRWYELGSGKRWSFRDLFSLVSYLLAGHQPSGKAQQLAPCEWAAKLITLDKHAIEGKKPGKQHSSAIFSLATMSYQHALFHRWDSEIAGSLLKDIKDLERENDNTLMGFYYFLQGRKAPYLPATISSLLEGIVDILDPAMANPDRTIPVSGQSSVELRELDARFSRSIEEGIEFIRKYQFLSSTELDLLKRLAKVDLDLTASRTRRKKPVAANRIQRLLRDFACRLVRRSLGARSAVVQDAETLHSFQQVVEDEDGSGELLYDVASEVEILLNKGEYFEVSLTTTFGQPLPPLARQATLVVPRRRVKVRETTHLNRPRSPICFLRIGAGQSEQSIALTYDLFKAVAELEQGMSVASLPRAVVALLDTTKARLSGPIVRDNEVLENATIRIGIGGMAIERRRGRFGAQKVRTRS
jgi:hypothetical protein